MTMNMTADVAPEDRFRPSPVARPARNDPTAMRPKGQDSADRPVEPQLSRPSSVRIRVAVATDWPALRSLVRRHHERTIFSDIPFSERKFDAIEARLKTPAGNECVIVAEIEHAIVGVAWFAAGEYALCENSLMTTTHIIAVDSDRCKPFRAAKIFIRLTRGIVAWSMARNAKRVLIHVTTGASIAATDRLIRAGGGKMIGGGYLISL